MRVILARASTRYEGRIDAELSLCDVQISLFPNGTCLVQRMTGGLQPANWMPAESEICDDLDDGATSGIIDLVHAKRGERLQIFVAHVYHQHVHTEELLTGPLLKLGAEREFSDLIARHLHLVDPGLELIAREAHTQAGPIDLLCVARDRRGEPTCIVPVEVKRKRIDPGDLYQLRRYMDALERSEEWQGVPCRGILIAPVLAKKAKPLIDADETLSFTRLEYRQLADLTCCA